MIEGRIVSIQANGWVQIDVAKSDVAKLRIGDVKLKQ